MIAIAKLRKALGLPMEDDGDLQDILDGVVGVWEEETKRLWSRRTGWIQTFRLDETKRLSSIFLELWPIETITKVEEKSVDAVDWTTLTTTQYIQLESRGNRIERIGAYWAPMVRVTYTGGYVAEPAVGATPPQNKTPLDVQEALITQAKFIRARTTADKLINSSQNFEGGAGVHLRPDLHPYFQRLSEQKRRKV